MQPQVKASTPQPVQSGNATIQTQGKLQAGLFRWSPSYQGTLSLIGNQLIFTDEAGATVVQLTPQQVTSISVTVGGLSFMAGGTRYSFVPGAARFAQAALVVGGIAGIGAAAAISNKAGIPEWKAALTAAGFNPKDMGLGTIAKIVIPLTIGLVVLIFIFMVIFGVANE